MSKTDKIVNNSSRYGTYNLYVVYENPLDRPYSFGVYKLTLPNARKKVKKSELDAAVPIFSYRTKQEAERKYKELTNT